MKKSGGLNADRKKIAVVISVVAVIAIAIGAYFADDFIGDTGCVSGKLYGRKHFSLYSFC